MSFLGVYCGGQMLVFWIKWGVVFCGFYSLYFGCFCLIFKVNPITFYLNFL